MVKVNLSHPFSYCFCLLLLCFSNSKTFAQYETANWIFSEYTLSFISENPVATNPVISNFKGAFASWSSDSGVIMISTDGSTVWNGKGEVMKNGENITPYRTNSMIIPKPESDSLYYIFSYSAFNIPGNNTNYYSSIVYALVDLKANNRKGEVIEKNKLLYNSLHGTFTISGNCERTKFWLVGDVDANVIEGSDKIFVFRIDKNGISEPFTSRPVSFGNSAHYKLSPDAAKLLFTVNGLPGPTGTFISDFKSENLPADPIVNIKFIPAYGAGEFSANSQFVYVVENYVPNNSRIIQYDIQTGKSVVLFSGPAFLGAPQMAANHKIYIPIGDEKRMMVINKPNLEGLLCDFSSTGISTPVASFVLPAFASNLFYKGPFPANAGSDKIICSDESVVIGSSDNNATTFSWEPTTYLDDPTKLQPTFHYTGSDSGINSFTYKLTTYFEGCSNSDLVVVRLVSKPQSPVIQGSKSVCPGVEGVEYWTEKKEGFSYQWNVNGGMIDGKSNLDSLRINWGSSNPSARVELQAIDQHGCDSDFALFNVRINVELQTETPQGLDSVCVNLTNQNKYQITKTTGSTYTWGVLGGEIMSDPSVNKVIVDWGSNAVKKIWVKEKSVTNEAVCFGNSDTLNITVFKDLASINLDFVTVDELDERIINLQASTSYASRIKEVSILSMREGSGIWEEIGNVASTPIMHLSRDNFLTDDYSYQFQIDFLNKCDERSSSRIHQSIRLTAEGDEENNLIDLRWNGYNFWNVGTVSYDVLSSLKEPVEYQKVVTIHADTSASINAEESFQYFLKVMAVRSDGVYASLSNEVKIDFERELVIPNVITPNQDGFNDTFEIKNIKLYPQNRLVILNRYGKVLYDQSGYQGGWNGEELSSGIYYFNLLLPEKQKEFKGWLQVIR